MKKHTSLFFMVLTISSGLFAQTVKKSHTIKPTNFKNEIATVTGGKTRIYYSLNVENSSVIKVKGPGKLKLITRAQFAPGQKQSVPYEIVYTVNQGEQKRLKVKAAERSTKATYQDGKLGVPGELKEFEIDINRGDNTIEFKLAFSTIPVAVRYVFTAKKEKKQDWIEFAPQTTGQVIELISHESAVNYYRFSTETPLKIDVLGPTELRIFTRPEFNFQMRGSINYRLQVKSQGKVLNTYQLSSRRSEIATYKNEKDLVPGKANEFLINVPAGKQTYEIIPLDKDKGTILSRMMIIKKDIKKAK